MDKNAPIGMTDRLPLEVCRRIIEHLRPITENSTLSAVSQTSRVLQPIAEQLLYYTLHLVGLPSVSTLLASFTSRPALVDYARHIYIHPNERRTPQHYWMQVVQLLGRVSTKLELLHIVAQDPDAPYTTWVLRGLNDANNTLNVLRVPFWWSNDMADFLESEGARAITRLETGDTHPMIAGMGEQQIPAPVSLDRSALPYLRIVEAPPNALCLLVPGRPVTHVKVRIGPSTTLQTLPPADFLVGECLVRSAAPPGVISLDIGDLTQSHHGETYSMEVIELAPRFLPNLKFMGKVNFPWTKEVPASRLYRPLIRLTELHTLELVVTNMYPPVDMYWERGTAPELRMFGPSLRQIVFFKGSEAHRWVWDERDSDFLLAPHTDRYYSWECV